MLSVNDWMNRAAIAIEAEAGHLTQLDAAIGDGDHGTNMMRGMRAVTAALADGDPDAPPGTRLILAGKTLVSTVGGASGPLGAPRSVMAGATGDTPVLDGPALVAVLTAALAAVQDLGSAEAGDKNGRRARTGGHGPRDGIESGDPVEAALAAAAEAAEEGARATTPMQARRAAPPTSVSARSDTRTGRDLDRAHGAGVGTTFVTPG